MQTDHSVPAPPNTIVASTTDSVGRTVVLTQNRWTHVLKGHPQLDGLEGALMRVIEDADKKKAGNTEKSVVLYKEGLGPANWLAVVVAYSGNEGQVLTAYPHSKEPTE